MTRGYPLVSFLFQRVIWIFSCVKHFSSSWKQVKRYPHLKCGFLKKTFIMLLVNFITLKKLNLLNMLPCQHQNENCVRVWTICTLSYWDIKTKIITVSVDGFIWHLIQKHKCYLSANVVKNENYHIQYITYQLLYPT